MRHNQQRAAYKEFRGRLPDARDQTAHFLDTLEPEQLICVASAYWINHTITVWYWEKTP